MSARNHVRKGFTLVEILIVVVILGILAAIVIPQFTNASEEARKNSLVSQLQSIRSQLELAQIQHQGVYPDLVADGWAVMTSKTDGDGDYTLNANGATGPYLQQAPKNPFAGSGDGTAVGAAANANVGWVYDQASGRITASISSARATSLGLSTTNDVSTY